MIAPGRGLRTLLICAVFAALLLGVSIYLEESESSDSGAGLDEIEKWVYPRARRARGAVASNGGPCAEIGMKILSEGGLAVDALIATMLCDGVTVMHNMGLGGGFLASLYIKREGKVVTLNARESAPAAATQDMFVQNTSLAQHGGLSIAVPGELRGYYDLYRRYGGGVQWSELFNGTIHLCREGVPVNQNLARAIANMKEHILNTPGLRKLLQKENGELPVYGDKIKLPKLAATLSQIAREGPDAIYSPNGTYTAALVKDIQDNGGIITVQDMSSYFARWEEPVSANLSTGHSVYTVQVPGSGPILTYILKLLDGQLSEPLDSLNTTFKVTEAFKFAYGIRSKLGDPYYVNDTTTLNQLNDPDYIRDIQKKLNSLSTSNDVDYYGSHFMVEDHGTANIVVVGPNGDVASATSTINTLFGSLVVSESTGLILNNEMDDFSTPGLINSFGVPPSPENFIAPGKRPLSSMVPTIVLDRNGHPTLVAGAAGGTKITTATALTILRHIWFNKTSVESVGEPRFHHQLMPMEWAHEPAIAKNIIEGMKEHGHTIALGEPTDSCATAISIEGDILGPTSDMRRPGNTSFLLTS